MSIIITLIAVIVGVFMIIQIVDVGKKRQMNEVYALMWLLGAAGIIILGIFPQILMWVADMFGITWPPAVLVFFLLVLVFFLLFSHSKAVSILNNQVTELTMQITLAKHENQELEKLIQKMSKDKDDEGTDM